MSKAFGEQNPTAGEDPVSWQTWSDGAGGTPEVTGDLDWGKMKLEYSGEEGRSAVYDLGSAKTRKFTININMYEAGSGSAKIEIRGSAAPFNQDDGAPAWELYTAPSVSKGYRYVQVRATTVQSASMSPSASQSPSASASPSISPSASASASVSPSVSPSISPSASESVSESPSVSPSISPSISPSESPSPSASLSPSASVSPSTSSAPGTAWYIDNAASGANDGTSWTDAWESFADFATDKANVQPGDTVYISGGSVSKAYKETLDISYMKGTASDLITFTVGANAPNPSGHNGTVIINGDTDDDGVGELTRGIFLHSAVDDTLDYIHINGRDGLGNYKWEIRNIIPMYHRTESMKAGVYGYNFNYVYIDGLAIPDIKQFGVSVNDCNYSRVQNCYVTSYDGAFDSMAEGILVCGGVNPSIGCVIENNYVVMRTTMDYYTWGDPPADPNDVLYGDCIQVYDVNDVVVRNNYMEWENGKGNFNCGGFMGGSGAVRGHSWFYNNVCIGCSFNTSLVFQIYAVGTYNGTGDICVFNNTLVAQEPTEGSVLHFDNNGDASYIGGIKNNIIYSTNGRTIYMPLAVATDRIDYNCLYSGDPSSLVFISGNDRTWASYTGLGYDANGINVDPDYDDTDEYRLNATSDCIEAGVNLSSYFTTDRDGITRPVGDDWDIGAYEYH